MLDPSLYQDNRELILGNTKIEPGHSTKINFMVGNLPSGSRVAIQMNVFRSAEPGLHVMVIGGVHGDEINGIELARRLLEQDVMERLTKGTLVVIPLLNVYGFIHLSRVVPDGKDVNRSFPGSSGGSLASRVARVLSKHLIPQVDVIIDCHTGSQQLFNYPQLRINRGDVPGYELARAFNPPFIFQRAALRGSLRKAAWKAGKICLTYEGGESSRLDGFSIARGIAGIQRVLKNLEMVTDAPTLSEQPIELEHGAWIRASAPGLFIWSKNSGRRIIKGEPIGTIRDLFGSKKKVVEATRDGFIIGHTNAPVVHLGDALFHIGY
jgi:predicted deacylase